ncbi:MAG: large conductance mechanosensitive channel protein MscL [Erysipelotrichaceae bacterium]|nr:large conductance mechanosensitive channel protein MscL [Erysipelotrichaceae bacterium]
MKNFFEEFKTFISRGNVLDMAVGVIVGGAFTAIVTSLTEDILTPLIGMLTGGIDVSGLSVTVGSAVLTYGKFLNAIINFLIVAFSVFCLVKAVNKLKDAALKKKEEEEEAAEEEAEAPEVTLLRDIKELLEKQGK